MANDGGIGRLNRRLAAIPGFAKEAAQKSVVRQAETMAKAMRAKAPRKTGKLRDSIVVTPPDATTPAYSQPGGAVIVPETTAVITAGNSEVRYAHLVEYGTNKTNAQPYFWPSVREGNKKAQRNIKTAITRAIKKEWGK